MTLFYAALIGGVVSAILLPVTNYLLIRILNRLLVKVIVEKPIQNFNHNYWTYSLRIKNHALTSLKNVIAFVSLNYESHDIVVDHEIKTYTVNTSDHPLMLSWAKVVHDRNIPNIDINQGESADLNFIRYHQNPTLPLIQIASEQGFYHDKWENKGRVLLKAHKDYYFRILITADNIFPIKKKLRFDQLTALIEIVAKKQAT